tara:strand:+ start:672 stop:1052 length:381 start_codon:yes stop_codon:yes gene_type:complete
MPNRDAIRKKLVYPILSTIEPEYPAEILGMSVINELNIAYCIAVNEIFVSLDKKATNAALAMPAVKLSAEITKYSNEGLYPYVDNNMNKRLVITVSIAPKYKILIKPNLIDKTPPIKPPRIVINKP